MKYTTEELFNMSNEELFSICEGQCETKKCPFKPSLRNLREDGFCIKETYHYIDGWIDNDECEIKYLKLEIKDLEEGIKKYKKWKNVFEKELKE